MDDDSQNNQHQQPHPNQHSQDHLLYSSQSGPRVSSTNDMNINSDRHQTDDGYHQQQTVDDGEQNPNQPEMSTNIMSTNQATLSSLSPLKHWTEVLYEVKGVNLEEYNIAGGSDYGQLPYLMDSGDIILEINDHRVAGLTRNDVIDLVKSKPVVNIKAVSSSSSFGLPIDLREYLSRCFPRGSVDHDLQAIIRDNVYMRTIPCTTRSPRPGEIDGVDYKFITTEEFLEMERSGVLLESGIFSGAHYGTPLPLSSPPTHQLSSPSSMRGMTGSVQSPLACSNYSVDNGESGEDRQVDALNRNNSYINSQVSDNQNQSDRGGENDAGENGVDGKNSSPQVNTHTLAAKRKRNRSNIAAIDAGTLPHGWERISDSHYGVYYIDHINKRTQYERPYEIELTKGVNGFGFTLIELDKGLVVVKSIVPRGPAHVNGVIQPGDVLVSVSGLSVSGMQHSDIAQLFGTFAVGDRVKLTFARGYQLPFDLSADDQREYEFINITLTRGSDGFGFTISDSNRGQKVKKILDMERCGLLRQGDILVNVNNIDLSSLPHTKVVDVLKECPIGEAANITVKRRKHFPGRTPVMLQSSSPTLYTEKESNYLPRNCKTPNYEMMTPQDMSQIEQYELIKGAQKSYSDYHLQQSHQLQESVNYSGNHYDANDYPSNYDSRDGDNITYSNIAALHQHQSMMNNPGLTVNSKSYSVDNQMYQLQSQDMSSLTPMFSSMQLNPYTDHDPASFQNGFAPTNVHGDSMIQPTDVRFSDEDEYEYFMVTLSRGEAGFGFRIVGGAEENRNIAVGSIVIGGVAHKDGILKAGDEILSINGQDIIGASHHQVVSLMSQCGRTVSMLIRRQRNCDAFDVILQRSPNEDFGFVIISCGNCALIGRIIESSPAQRCGRLRIRDKIIMVNGQDITNTSHPEVVNMIKESGRTLHLRIMPADCYSVELNRGPKGFGFSIRGGAEFNGMPLFVLRIAPDGPAYSLLSIGDEIIEINGYSTVGMSHPEAVQLIHQSGSQVKLKLRRGSNPNFAPPPSYDSTQIPPSIIYNHPYSSYSAPSLMQLPQHSMHPTSQ
ncbi:membrane-associated guanylate kinase, WW and PDZ domain-containing protein 1-like [Brevipalpus obovatus]|uniref:membrane-associated guanylate kinase, WW and PDZ domain-containing protein 1-like n=1 Tax=Brevipalpus obovatus TaxID=246614 RepID=UPI003D9E504F